MNIGDALSLADFINGRGSRFHAKVLPFSDKGWVIVADKHCDQYLEPIADPQDYLRRSRLGVLEIDAAYHDLIAEWITEG